MSDLYPLPKPGPHRADELHEGDPYELSDGHRVVCMPASVAHAASNLSGGAVLDSDPAVAWAGVDAGYAPDPHLLRAPDVAVGVPANQDGWIRGAPLLAVEYAGVGQHEGNLKRKIEQMLAAGTRIFWIVRLDEPRRVEIHQKGKGITIVGAAGVLEAPGILKNPVPVRALFDREAAHEVVLRNLLQRRGYESLEDVRAEAAAQSRATEAAEGLLLLLAARGFGVDDEIKARIREHRDLDRLHRWLVRAATAQRLEDVFDPPL